MDWLSTIQVTELEVRECDVIGRIVMFRLTMELDVRGQDLCSDWTPGSMFMVCKPDCVL